MTAQHSPLTSLNFAALKVKDAIADRFRENAMACAPAWKRTTPMCACTCT